jgi:pimeloyl-ACP methyl ester carboxylesterase
MPFAQADDASVYYEVHGTGPALVFAHGGDANTLIWWQQVPYFRSHYTVLLFDARGFGRSTCPPAAQQPRLKMQDLAAVMDAAGIERAAMVGHSFGGYSVLPYALKHPDRVSCVVLAGSPAGVRLRGHERASRRNIERLQRGLSLHETYMSQSFLRACPERVFLYDQITALNPPPSALPGALDPSSELMLIEPSELGSFTVPALAIASGDDPNYYVYEVSELAELLGAKLVVMDGVGHPAYFEAPEAFNRIVHDFLLSCGW